MIAYHRLREAILRVERRPNDLAGAAITAEKLQQLRSSEHLRELLDEIRAEATLGVTEPLPSLDFDVFKTFHEQGTRLEYEQPYFRRRARLLSLSLALLIDGEDEYRTALQRTVWEICGEYSWAISAHLAYDADEAGEERLPPDTLVDLFAAETAHALAEMLTLLGDQLHPWIVQRVRSEIERRVFEPCFRNERPFFWFSADHNWSAVCAGAVGMAAMLLIDDRERLAWAQAKIADAMDSFLSGYGDDGCCMEGAGYWTYGFGYYVYWAEMLHAYTDGELDLLQSGKVRRIAEYAGSVALSLPACVNYSDCSPEIRLHPGLISRLQSRIGISAPVVVKPPSFHDDHCYRWPHQVRNLLWSEQQTVEEGPPSGTIRFPDAGWVIDKRQTSAGLFAFSAKGGTNDEPHNHNDLGQFIVHAAGETLLTDLGPGMYTQEYFSAARYEHLHTSSLGHSVPVINGCEQESGKKHRAEIIRSVSNGDRMHFDLDLTQAYGKAAGLSSYIRHFTWTCQGGVPSAVLEVRDVFEFVVEKADPESRLAEVRLAAADEARLEEDGNPLIEDESAPLAEEGSGHRVTEHFISLYRPETELGTIIWQGEQGRAELQYNPACFEVVTEELDTHRHLGEKQEVYRTALIATSLKRRFVAEWTLRCSTKQEKHHPEGEVASSI